MMTNPDRTSKTSRLRPVLCAGLFIAAGMVAVGANSSSRGTGQRARESPRQLFYVKIAPWVIEHTANRRQAEFSVVLADQADLSGAEAIATKAEKGRYVYDALWNKSTGDTTTDPAVAA